MFNKNGRIGHIRVLRCSETNSFNVNATSSNVANRSNNGSNANSGVSYLNLNNTPSNTNANIGSQLLLLICRIFLLTIL